MDKIDLTIVIPVLNEALNLPRCLAAIGDDFAVKTVLVDSGSKDETLAIAATYNVEVIKFRWDGKFPKKRNWYLRNHKPSTKWVLFLDADEVITPEFKRQVRKVLPASKHVGYWLSYSIYFLGRRLKWGYPLRKLALFRVDAGEYEKIDEERWSNLDMEVHEHPILDGNIGFIRSQIDHRDFRGIAHYIIKHNEYSAWEASRYLKRASEVGGGGLLTFKQRIKYKMMRSSLIGPCYFMGSFFLMGGFFDGVRGFIFSWLKASYFLQVYCKILEGDNKDRFCGGGSG